MVGHRATAVGAVWRNGFVRVAVALVAALVAAGCGSGAAATTTVERTVETTRTVTVTTADAEPETTPTTETSTTDIEDVEDDDEPASTVGGARNLRATAAVKRDLRVAFMAAHDGFADGEVAGPLPGRTYYGAAGSTEWAVATFSLVSTGTTDQPETFQRPAGGAWADLGDNGNLCRVPRPLIRMWQLDSLRGALCA